ncbi:MAG: hypothetical protein ACYDH3_04235, partial [Candidatus Aminicenantales bacterium]
MLFARRKMFAPILLVMAVLWSAPGVCGQGPGPAEAGTTPPLLKVFLDGNWSAGDYVRTEVPFVSYVRDPKDADVHIITTSLSSGAGTEYQIEWIGRGPFSDIHFTLKYFVDRLATYDESREGFIRVLKKGLMPFVSRTGLTDRVKISYDEASFQPVTPPSDPWDGWIFSLSLGGTLSGETSYGTKSSNGSFSVGRTTEAFKTGASWSGSVSQSRYTIEGEDYLTSVRSWSSAGWAIWALGGHWSAGVAAAANSSTYKNIQTSLSISPAQEFDVLPYSESTRKELTLLYRLTYGHVRYREITIYDKMSESRWSQSLTAYFEATQPWGEAYASVVGSHYFHDVNKNRLTIDGYLSVRVWKGLSVYASGSYSKIHDQLSLAKG